MNLIRKIMLSIALSPYTQVARFAVACLSCLFIMDVVNMTKIDIATYGIPDEYMPYMLVFALFAGLIGAFAIRYKLHDIAETNKHDKGKLDMEVMLPYDKRYDKATFIGFVLGVGVAMFAAPAVVNAVFINAATWTYAGITALCALILVPVITVFCHFGVRMGIEFFARKAVEVTDAVKDAMGDIQKAVDNIDDIKDAVPKDAVPKDAVPKDDADAPIVP